MMCRFIETDIKRNVLHNKMHVYLVILILLLKSGDCKIPETEKYISGISLAQCVTEIAKKYFTKSGFISYFISNTRNNPLVLQYLFEQNSWTFNLYNTRYVPQEPSEGGFVKPITYLIDFNNLEEFKLTVKNLKKVWSFDSHANFLVISYTKLENQVKDAQHIIQLMWKENIIEIVIILRDLHFDNKYNVITWHPYLNGNCGNNFTTIKRTDSCSSGVIKNTSKLPWFGNKTPKLYNGCVIRANYNNIAPSVINMINNTYSKKQSYFKSHGVDVNVLNVLAEKLNLTVKYATISDTPLWGDISPNGTASGNVLILMDGKTDVLVGSFINTLARNLYLDISTWMYLSSMNFCVPYRVLRSTFKAILGMFFEDVFVVWALCSLCLVSLMWCSTRHRRQEREGFRGFQNVLKSIYSALLAVSLPNLPRTSIPRFVFSITVFYGLISNCIFTTFLTSVLTYPDSSQKYDTFEDLIQHRLELNTISTLIGFFDHDNNIQSMLKECNNITECVGHVEHQKRSAFLFHKHNLQHLEMQAPGGLYVQPTTILSGLPVCIIMANGFPMFEQFNYMINYLRNSGIIDKWMRDHQSTLHLNGYKPKEYVRLNLRQIGWLFLVLIGGYLLALCRFVFEYFYDKTIRPDI